MGKRVRQSCAAPGKGRRRIKIGYEMLSRGLKWGMKGAPERYYFEYYEYSKRQCMRVCRYMCLYVIYIDVEGSESDCHCGGKLRVPGREGKDDG